MDLPATLATPWLCAVPPETPIEQKGVAVVPSAGPYYVDIYDPGKRVVLLRNPNYHGPRPSEFAEIDYEGGVSPHEAVSGVEAGTYDHTLEVPVEERADLERLYGPRSEAASAGRQQYFVEPSPRHLLHRFNKSWPPFDDPRLRRAVNFAIDRAALAAEPLDRGETGRPTDQYIPPGFPGFADEAIYPLGGPDVERARELAGDLDRSATLYTCSDPTCAETAEVIRSDLAAIGIEVEVRQFPVAALFDRLLTPGEPWDLAQFGWYADYADPSNFINAVFRSRGPPYTYLDDPRFARRMAAAARLSGARRYRAYARLDRDLASKAAPAAAYASGPRPRFFSARIGCQVNQPLYGIVLGELCLRE